MVDIQHLKDLERFNVNVLHVGVSVRDCKLYVRSKNLLLYNPGLTRRALLEAYRKYRVNNSIDDRVLTEKYEFLVNRYDHPYYFICGKNNDDAEEVSTKNRRNVTGIVHELAQQPSRSMTFAEAIIYHLYCQFVGMRGGFPGCCLVTCSNAQTMNMPISIGMDEYGENLISLYDPHAPKIIYKKVYLETA